ncbi:MAG: protein kinase [Deltaproteobacteria bacterium]|nr:protein kinase [Deltaproteobacteria bacterium]
MKPATEPVAPDTFGPYEVYERLGMGGMAQVHRAKKRGPAGFERSVALKRMLSHLAEDSSFVESFIREAKVVSLLVHPNIAQVYDFGRIGGIYYIAMELVPGFDLRKLLRYANRANEPIPLPVVLSILGELCDALEYAHTCKDEQGTRLNIVHRDISPSNMIIAATGHLKVIDFGIAKASARQLHTESGQVKGKLGYMSPEAALGIASGPVSDVFSMGVVAWELVTASPLFSARTDFETMRKIREQDVAPPSRHNPSSPPELDRLVLAALERDPKHRLPSASAFRQGLDEIAAKYGIHVSARAVAEWIQQFLQPEDFVSRSSGRTPPPESSTAILRPSAKQRLQRSVDEIALATEIWGEDAQTVGSAPPAGPDFSVDISAGAQVPTLSGLALPAAADVRFSPSTAPGLADLQLTAPGRPRSSPMPQGTPAHHTPPVSAPSYAPPPEAEPKKKGFLVVGVLAFVAAAGGGVLILKSMKHPPPEAPPPTGSAAVAMATVTVDAAMPAVEPQHDPNDELKPDDHETPEPTPTETHKPTTPTTRPKHHGTTTKHVTAAVPADAAVAEPPPPPPPPEVKPDAAVEVKKPDVTPVVETPKAPARTPVVAASAVTKLSGDLPTIRGDSDGDALVKMCIDDGGAVTSVKVVRATAQMPSDLTRALQGWRYKPYANKDGKAQPVCFALSLRVEVKSGD